MGKYNLVKFIDGDGNGYGYGYGYGYGDGCGSGFGNGFGDGFGNGFVDGSGYGDVLVFVAHDTPIIAYHYINPDNTLIMGNVKRKLRKGSVLNHYRIPEMCRHGLHASTKKEDAKQFANVDSILTKVACSGWVKFSDDKFVCTKRKILEFIEQ